MQSLRSSVPVTSSHKRARCLSFPGGFEERILRRLTERSAFIKAQLECLGDDVASGRLQLPEETGSLWIDCILSTRAELRATDDETLAAYLKASEFFQDWDTVKELCQLLCDRLYNSACSHLSAKIGTKQHIAQVLEALSSNLVMEVLRSAPGGLQKQLPLLPRSLAPLAALAHIPGLAATCSPASDCSDQGASEGYTALTLCVDTRPVESAVEASADEADDTAGTSMWLQRAAITDENIVDGLFTLESRVGVVACQLLARVSALQGMTVRLPDCASLLLASTLKLQGVTFQGGAVVCSGANCKATFEDTVFDGCSLLVLSAAQATVSNAAFRNGNAQWPFNPHQSGLAMFVHGVSSRVAMQGGSVEGGTQAVAVQAGGHLEATGLTITGVGAVGAEVGGEGSCLSLTGCQMTDFVQQIAEDEDSSESEEEGMVHAVGVHVHSSSSAHLSCLSVDGRHSLGVCVTSSASATLVDCNVSDSRKTCVGVYGCSTGNLTRCTLLNGYQHGLSLHGQGTNVHATECRSLQNMFGAAVGSGSTLSAEACASSGNRMQGFFAFGVGSVVELTDCTSDHDEKGCSVRTGATLRATRVAVTNSSTLGYHAETRGEMVLMECSATACRTSGVQARGTSSRVHVEGCIFKQNGKWGVVAAGQAEVTVEGCHSSQHSIAGYHATGKAHMKVSHSVSEGDTAGCTADGRGQLTMEEVTVDGTLQSGQLP